MQKATLDLSDDQRDYWSVRPCLRKPTADLFEAAASLDLGVGAHLNGDRARAAAQFRSADTQSVRDYIECMWGKRALWPEQTHYLRHRPVEGIPPPTPETRGTKVTSALKRTVVERDGFRCRYCSLPVIPASIRKVLAKEYPADVPWGSTNNSQHAAFQALWLQFDHVVPLSRGGPNDAENVVVSCAACNFMKWDYHLEEMGLSDPRSRPPLSSCWDGLSRLVGGTRKCVL